MSKRNMQSLLGAPPKRNAYSSQQQFGRSSLLDQPYSRRGDTKGSFIDYFGSGSQQQQQQLRVPRDRADGTQPYIVSVGGGTWRRRSPSPLLKDIRGGVGISGMSSSDTWGRSVTGGTYEDSISDFRSGMRSGQEIQSLQMSQNSNLGQSSDQMVMVVPQGNNTGSGMMGMVPIQSNSYGNMFQRQQPLQVVLGQHAFGQQAVLTSAASDRSNNTMMSLMSLPQQYDSSIVAGGSRRSFSRQQSSNIVRRNRSPDHQFPRRSGQSFSSKALNRGGGGSTNYSSAQNSRGRKRVVLRDRHGATDEVQRKKQKPNPNPRVNNNNAKGNNPKSNNNNTKGNSNARENNNVRENNKVGPKNKRGPRRKNKNQAKKEQNKKNEDKKDDVIIDGKEKESETKNDDQNGEVESAEDKEKRMSEFEGIPNSLFVCKICQKVMNDSGSFASHLIGRAHNSRVNILEQRFEKRSELLVSDSKLSEEEIGIELYRQRRGGKSGPGGKMSKKNFCAMCDCHFSALSWGSHKLSTWHRILKDFLHPNCELCTQSFVHRIDWAKHLYSFSHLQKLAEKKEQGEDVSEHESCRQDELFTVHVTEGLSKNERLVPLIVISTDYKVPNKVDLKEMLKNDKGEIDLPEGDIEIPMEFSEDKTYGEEAIMDVEGACCKVCLSFIGYRTDVEAHIKSKEHYTAYVKYLKKVVAYRAHLKEEQEKAEKEAVEEAEKKKKEEKEKALKNEDGKVGEVEQNDEDQEEKEEEDGMKIDDDAEGEEEGTEMENTQVDQDVESVVESKEETDEAPDSAVIESEAEAVEIDGKEEEGESKKDETEIKISDDDSDLVELLEEVKETVKEIIVVESPKPVIKGILKNTSPPTKAATQSRGGQQAGRARGSGPRGGRGGGRESQSTVVAGSSKTTTGRGQRARGRGGR